ncbi:uncharacterized protein LOC120157646 [Hibiscus syriacus]|uniref:uncharacterized protein LOC120157646 n=1 Tax=Hibiscus syriacus TaxID=106335 RepID=UPI001921864D|nr:uncharacterized protein LOC120157646 [Hibiscus syriacus]
MITFIEAVPPPFSNGGDDKQGWKWEHNRQFTTKSAYRHRASPYADQDATSWDFLNKYKGTPSEDAAVVNLQGTATLECRTSSKTSYLGGKLCDLWGCSGIVFPRLKGLSSGESYLARRNRPLFDEDFGVGDSIFDRSNRLVNEMVSSRAALLNARLAQGIFNNRQDERWQPPASGWFKLNSDGARHTSTGITSCGGVIRDANGEWIMGYAKPIGTCSVLDAELWGIFEGLKLAWHMQLPAVIIETDSSDAAAALKEDGNRWGIS